MKAEKTVRRLPLSGPADMAKSRLSCHCFVIDLKDTGGQRFEGGPFFFTCLLTLNLVIYYLYSIWEALPPWLVCCQAPL